MGSRDNLKPFPKGVSGNPAGRRKGQKNISTVLAEMLKKIFPDAEIDLGHGDNAALRQLLGKSKLTNADAIAARIILKALKGDAWAIGELMDRTEGKVKEKVELTGENGGPVAVSVAFEKNLMKIYGDESETD
jgi:hypothetical protein